MLSKLKDRQKANELTKKMLRKELSFDEPKRPVSKLAQKKKEKRKQQLKQLAIYAGILLCGYLVWWVFKPFKKGLTYGVCKVFIQLYVPYPYTLHYSEAYDFDTSVRIWFSHMDAYGYYRLQRAECFYRPDDTYGMAMDRVTIDRREVDPERIDDFNRSLQVVIQAPPDLTYPEPLPRSLDDLQFDFDRFRKQIL